jgi:hypothetical protein
MEVVLKLEYILLHFLIITGVKVCEVLSWLTILQSRKFVNRAVGLDLAQLALVV